MNNTRSAISALQDARNHLAWVSDALRDANCAATAVESLVILPLIGDAARLHAQVGALLNAMKAPE